MAKNIIYCLVFILYFNTVNVLCRADESSSHGLNPSQAARLRTLTELSSHGHDHILGTNEKRCLDPTHDHFHEIVGNAKIPSIITRRDIQKDFMRKQCENCLDSPLCKNQKQCEICSTYCNPLDEKKLQLASRDNLPEEAGLSENQDRYYTVASIGPGSKQNLISRLLNVDPNENFERLIILSKNKSKVKPTLVSHPVVIDTAHVFTVNDGKANQVDLELHEVHSGDNFEELTSKLNKELDAAIDTKKKIRGDSHLTPEEIDKIIDHAIAEKPSTNMRSNTEDSDLNEEEEAWLGIAGNDDGFDDDAEGFKKKKKKKGYSYRADHDEENEETDLESGLNEENGKLRTSDDHLKTNQDDEEELEKALREVESKLRVSNTDNGFDDGADGFKEKNKKKGYWYRTNNFDYDEEDDLKLQEDESKLGIQNNDNEFEDGRKEQNKKNQYTHRNGDENEQNDEGIKPTVSGIDDDAINSSKNKDSKTHIFRSKSTEEEGGQEVDLEKEEEVTTIQNKAVLDEEKPIPTESNKMRSNQPGYQTQSAYQTQPDQVIPDYQTQYEQQSQPAYQAQPGYQPQSGYQKQPAYQEKAGYQTQPGYKDQTGYQAQPEYQPQSAYEAQPTYQEQAGYQAQPGYKDQPGYKAQPAYQSGYQANPGYQAQPEHHAQTGYHAYNSPENENSNHGAIVDQYGNHQDYDKAEELPVYVPLNDDNYNHPPPAVNQYQHQNAAPNSNQYPVKLQPTKYQQYSAPSQPQQAYPIKSQPTMYQQYSAPSQPQQANKVQTEETYNIPAKYSPKYNEEAINENLSPIEMDDELPTYSLNNEYIVGSKNPQSDETKAKSQEDVPKFDDPQSQADFYKQEYEKLKSLLKERSNVEEPSDKLVKDFTKIIKNDLAEDRKLNTTTDDQLDETISGLIEENLADKNRTETKFENKLDEIASGLEPIVNSQHTEKTFGNRFTNKEKHFEKHGNMAKILGNHRLRYKNLNSKFEHPRMDILGDSKRNSIEDKAIVDPKFLNLKNIVKDIKTVPDYLIDRAEKVADVIQQPNKFRQSKNSIETPQLGARYSTDEEANLDDTVACKKKLFEDDEETMYLQPYSPYSPYGGNGGGAYRSSDKNGKTLLDKILHPRPFEKANKDEPVTLPTLPDLIRDLENLKLPTLPPFKNLRQLNRQIPHIQLNGERIDPSNQNINRLDEFPQQENVPQFQRNQQEFFPNVQEFGPEEMEFQQGFNQMVGAPIAAAEEGKINTNIDENGNQQMFFLGDGIKFPLQMVQNSDGSKHLTVDLEKLCKCNHTFCFNNTQNSKHDFANEQLQTSPDLEQQQGQNERNSDVFKRSPLGEPDYMYRIKNPEEVNRNLENKFRAYKNDLNDYFDHRNQFQDALNQGQINGKQNFDDEDVLRRVKLVSNVLSWMKDVAIDGVPNHAEQHN